jgi:site-specific recombinase XerD
MGMRLERPAGPLAAHRAGYRAELERLGHTGATIGHHLVVFSQLDRFMLAGGLGIGALDEGLLRRFVAARAEENLAACRSPRMLAPLLALLRRQGVIGPAVPAEPGSPAEVMLAAWRRYLLAERGMTPEAARGYVDPVRPLLAARDDGNRVRLEDLGAREISDFMLGRARRYAPKTMQRLASALRSFLGWAFMTALMQADLSAAVPCGAACAPALPKFLAPAQVEAMIGGCDLASVKGVRDRAILLLLWRLGLRSGEVAGLRLGDIDWRAGTVSIISGKGRKDAQLPLPADVGAALAAWLRVRPRTGPGRAVFAQLRAPHRGLTGGGVTMAVAAASERAGLGTLHAHRLRHSAATAMLAGGASLPEIGQVLRHDRPATTSLYARVDVGALRALARPWTGTGAA